MEPKKSRAHVAAKRWRQKVQEKQPDTWFSPTAVMKVAAARMNAKALTPQRGPTHHMLQLDSEYLLDD